MKSVDRMVPWGRPSEDVIARRRSRKNHTMHRQRLKDSRMLIDSTTPSGSNMRHLANRAKKRQMADDRLQAIANENRKLMEKMSAIMRKSGPARPDRPLMKGEAIYGKGGLHEITRKREQKRIQRENRKILENIRSGNNTRSFYDRGVMAKEEREREKYVKNISKKYKREERVRRAEARREMMRASAPSLADMGGPEMSEGYGQIMEPTMNLTLRTARQIRDDVATQRGLPLPDLMSRRPGAGPAPKAKTQPFGQKKKAVGDFVMTHQGRSQGYEDDLGEMDDAFANMSMFEAGNRAESPQRPGTTAQSERSRGSTGY